MRTLGLQPDEKLFPICAKAFEVGIPAFEAFEAIGFPKLTVRLFALLTFKEAHITELTDNGVAGRHRHKNESTGISDRNATRLAIRWR